MNKNKIIKKSVTKLIKYELTLFLSIILLMGCAVRQSNKKDTVITIKQEFDNKEVSWFKKEGTGRIKGIAKFRTKKGEIYFGEEFRIELMPYCLYTDERLNHIYRNKKFGFIHIEDGVPKFVPDPEGYHDTKKTMCNKEGEFEFDNLPAGKYYVIAFMILDKENIKTGGGIMQSVVLSENESKTIEMKN